MLFEDGLYIRAYLELGHELFVLAPAGKASESKAFTTLQSKISPKFPGNLVVSHKKLYAEADALDSVHNFDRIVANYRLASGLRVISKPEKLCMLLQIGFYASHMAFMQAQVLTELTIRGAKFALESEHQAKQLQKLLANPFCKSAIGFSTDMLARMQADAFFSTPKVQSNHNGRFCTFGRNAPEKRLAQICRLAHKAGIALDVFTNGPELSNKAGEVFHDLSHKEAWSKMAEYKAFVHGCDIGPGELVMAEALSHGLSLITNNPASLEKLDKGLCYVNKLTPDCFSLVDSITHNRQEIADEVCRNLSFDSFKKRLIHWQELG